MAGQLLVEVVAVEEKIWSGQAEMLVARTTEGELGILPGHMSLMGELAEPSQVRVVGADDGEHAWDVTGGFLSVTQTRVTVLAESATPVTSAAH